LIHFYKRLLVCRGYRWKIIAFTGFKSPIIANILQSIHRDRPIVI